MSSQIHLKWFMRINNWKWKNGKVLWCSWLSYETLNLMTSVQFRAEPFCLIFCWLFDSTILIQTMMLSTFSDALLNFIFLLFSATLHIFLNLRNNTLNRLSWVWFSIVCFLIFYHSCFLFVFLITSSSVNSTDWKNKQIFVTKRKLENQSKDFKK